jgi:hypothetical protein
MSKGHKYPLVLHNILSITIKTFEMFELVDPQLPSWNKMMLLLAIIKRKSMVRWLMFDILKSSHLTLTTILHSKQLSNYKSYNYPLWFWSQMLIVHLINIPKHMINQEI